MKVISTDLRPIKTRLDSVSIPCRLRVFSKFAISLVLFLCLGIGNVWGNDYTINGECTDWDDEPMTVSTGGNYEYFGPITTIWNDFSVSDGVNTYGSASVVDGFNSTDVTIGDNGGGLAYVDNSDDPYYIIVWYPNTDFNSNSTPVICASTTLPDDTSIPSGDKVIYSATAIATSNVAVPHSSNLTVPSTAATITGGTMVIYNRYSSDDLTPIRPNFGPTGDQMPAFYLSGGSVSFQVNISGYTLEDGDIISAKIYARQYAVDGNGLWFSTSSSRPGSAPTEKAVASSAAGSAWTNVSYTVTSSDALNGVSSFYIYLGLRDQSKTTIVFTDFVITRPAVCAAPNHVDITGTNKYLGGQTVSLTATAYSTAGTGSPIAAGNITGYQWQKEINSVWTNVTNGTTDGVTISGATTNILQITPCTHQNSGQYRCIISTGATCSTTSDAYGVHIFSIYGHYYGGEYAHNEITWTSGTTGTATIHLNASSTYLFKVWSNDGYYYGNGTNNYIIQPINWNCGTGNSEMRLLTGPEGDYTFTVNIEHGLDGSPYVNLQVAYPSVSHPSTGYMYITKWWGTCYVHYWEGTNNALSPWGYDPALNSDRYVEICGTNYWYFPVIDTYNKVIAKDAAGDPSNTTGDQVSTDHGGKYITHDGSWGWHDFTTYTISFNNGGGSGTMSSITGICPNDNQAIPANLFTKPTYVFDHWTANVNVTVGGATVTAGDPIANGATIQNITSNITLTAQWVYGGPTIVNIPGTVNKGNVLDVSDDTWWTTDNDYYDFGTGSGASSRSIEWTVNLTASGVYSVTEDFYSVYTTFWKGHQWYIELIDDGDNVVSDYTSTQVWLEHGPRTDALTWDLSGVTPGEYTLRVTNPWSGSEPKLKSLTFAIPFTYTKVPDRAEYGDSGDAHRAYGTIEDDVVTVPLSSTGAISKNDATRTLIIGSETVVAPETEDGRLDNIPYDKDPFYTYAYPVWRFDHWDITDLNDIKAVYIPTFAVDYQTNGGVINNDPYAHWYRYTGREEDYTELPMNLTKEGFVFAGWYQNSTTQLFSTLPGHYYGNYAIECTGEYSTECDYRLKAHWILDCDEAQVLSGVKITGSGTSSYDLYGYNEEEYAGTPVVNVGSTTVTADADNDGNNETGYELDTNGSSIVFATLKKGDFRAGDLVRVVITRKNTNRIISGSYDNITLYYGTGTSDARVLVNIQRIKSDTIVEYYLDADDVVEMASYTANGVGVFRESSNGENPCVYSVEIIGCRDLVFDDAHGTHVWSDPLNWGPTHSEIPHYYQATRINKPCIVDIANAKALNVKLCKQYEDRNGSLVINANAGLEVTQRVSEVHGTDYSTLYPVQASDLVILSNASNQGALVHGDNGSNTHATVQLYARGANAPANTATWQYMGVPFSDVTRAQSHYYGAWMCEWIENTAGNAGSNWKWVENEDHLYPFVGYCLTQEAAMKYTNTGTLVPSTNKTLSLTYAGTTGYTGWNMFANSYMAPIQIANFIDGDFVGDVDKTIYLFNTGINKGNQTDWPDQDTELGNAGQYVAVPIHTAVYLNNNYIPPMQGFYLLCRSAGTTTVTLNYERLVRNIGGALSVNPTRAPKAEQTMPMLRIDVKGSHFSDKLYIFENEEQTNDFDNGWDGYKFDGETYAPQLMTRTSDLDLAVDVSPAFGGKRIAFRVGEDNEYTLHFSTTEQGLQLRDLKTNAVVDIVDGGEYSFMAFNTTSEERFEIIDNRQQIPNGIDEIPVDATGKILDMTVYTMDGRLVLHRTTDFNKPLGLPQNGTYIVYLTTTTGKHVHKIVF